MITYEFLLDNELLLVKISGAVDKGKMLSFLKFLFDKKEMIHLSKAIMDFRTTKFNFSTKDLEEIVELRKGSSDLLGKIQTVHMVSTSFETAYIILFAKQIPQRMADIEVCSTVKRSIQYLNIDITEQNLENYLENLAFSYPL